MGARPLNLKSRRHFFEMHIWVRKFCFKQFFLNVKYLENEDQSTTLFFRNVKPRPSRNIFRNFQPVKTNLVCLPPIPPPSLIYLMSRAHLKEIPIKIEFQVVWSATHQRTRACAKVGGSYVFFLSCTKLKTTPQKNRIKKHEIGHKLRIFINYIPYKKV